MYAVKSTGTGHGSSIPNEGRTPQAIVAWLTHNRDLLIVSKPATAVIAGHLRSTTVAVGVSKTAKYGDPGCPANPRCADLFTTPLWGNNSFGIGGAETVGLYLATIKKGGRSHTFYIALDAPSDAKLVALTAIAKPVITHLQLPKGVTAG
jgi:hypothetical protein